MHISRRELLRLLAGSALYAAIPEPLKALAGSSGVATVEAEVRMLGSNARSWEHLIIDVPLEWFNRMDNIESIAIEVILQKFYMTSGYVGGLAIDDLKVYIDHNKQDNPNQMGGIHATQT